MYKVNEIFYSLQGEGFWTGTPMVFVRLSGCNLRCPFCDTNHSEFRLMTVEDIVKQVTALDPENCGHVCITGGEPLLQLGTDLIDALHRFYYSIHVETNGTKLVPRGVDWVTLSPKEDVRYIGPAAKVVLDQAQEVKLVYDGTMPQERIERWAQFPAKWHFLQHCDTGDPSRNPKILKDTVAYIKSHTTWRLSLQTHKIIGVR
jgi:organic radical activating enzyme